MKKVLILALAAGISFSTPVVGETYNCKIKPQRKGDWIPSTLAINYNPKTDKVIVNDDFIMHYLGKPVAGKVVTNTDKRIAFSWILPEIRDSRGQNVMRFIFKATYLKRKRRMIVTSYPSGYDNNFRGTGTCSIK